MLGFPSPEPGLTTVGSLRDRNGVRSLRRAASASTPPTCNTPAAPTSLNQTIDKLWLFLGLGVLGGTLLAMLAGLTVANRAMRPIARLTSTARDIASTRDPSQRMPVSESEDEVAELALTLDQMLRELDAARTETEQVIQVTARVHRGRVTRAAHSAHEHPRQPRAAAGAARRGPASRRGGGDRCLGPPLVPADAQPGRRPAAAGPSGCRAHGSPEGGRPGRDRRRRGP